MKVKVNSNTQVNHEGTVYEGGQLLDLPDAMAHPLIASKVVSVASTVKASTVKDLPPAKSRPRRTARKAST